MKISKGAQTIQTIPNAGGTSVNSEVFSFEIIHTMFNAQLEATEMELEYFPLGSKITDYSVKINGEIFGVSVTRAMKFNGGIFTEEEAERLLNKKLYGVNISSKAVLKRFRWKKQFLHIWAENRQIAQQLEHVFQSIISPEMKSNTIVMVTICENSPFIFYDQ